jgi:hypothetical protein
VTADNLGVQLGQLVIEATKASIDEVIQLVGEDTTETLVEYLTLMQFAASRKTAIVLSERSIDPILDEIRRTGADMLEDAGLAVDRARLERFQEERYGLYYAAILQDEYSYPSEVLARIFLSRCRPCVVSSARFEQGDVASDDPAAAGIAEHIEQLDHQVTDCVLESLAPCSDGEPPLLPVAVDVRRRDNPSRDVMTEFITSNLQKDLDSLSKLEESTSQWLSPVAAGAIAWAGYEALTGDWLSVLAITAVLLLTGGLVNRYRRRRISRTRRKWRHRLSQLEESQLSDFMTDLNTKHPSMVARLHRLLLSTTP